MRVHSPLVLLAALGALALWPACAAAVNFQIGAESSGSAAAVRSESREQSRSPEAEPPSRVEKIVKRIPAWVRSLTIALAAIAVVLAGLSIHEWHRRRKTEHAALVDPLTGVANRLAFEQRLAREWHRSERYGRPLGVLLIDLDDFKLVNDREGHAAGDELLRRVAERMSSRLRETDMLARFGGDEFAAICPETSMPNLDKLAGILEQQAAELPDTPIGLSIGCAEYERRDREPLDMIERADASMYERKRRRGRFSRSRRGTKLTRV
jgi:diguanylate cyclase (GGDEF)-like protein